MKVISSSLEMIVIVARAMAILLNSSQFNDVASMTAMGWS